MGTRGPTPTYENQEANFVTVPVVLSRELSTRLGVLAAESGLSKKKLVSNIVTEYLEKQSGSKKGK